VESMLEAGSFRGPHGRRVWRGEGAALGHLALHVSPESESECQPLVDRETGIVVVTDARIDNREELRRRLRIRPSRGDAAPGDAALVLAAYRRWGSECTAQLVGDFAFALWDPTNRRLLAARDPMGMRGLYYRTEANRVLFATEAEQILAVQGVPARVCEPAVGVFLAGGWPSAERTYYRGIRRLAPAHALELTERGLRSWRYWDVDPTTRIRYRRHEEYAEHFRELFTEAVRSRTRSRTPVGILLSGGLDSMSLTATAGWLRKRDGDDALQRLRAYSFTFQELTQCDERHISDALARHYGIPVTGVPADDAWPLRSYPESGPHRTEPFMFGHHTVLERGMAMAHEEGVRLVLSGDRGDLVAGMAIFDHPSLFWSGRWITLARELRTLAEWKGITYSGAAWKQLIKPARKRMGQRTPRALKRLLGRSPRQPRRTAPHWVSSHLAETVEVLNEEEAALDMARFGNLARQERYRAIFTPLHMTGVGCSERMHARFGQSFADPWSDVRLVQFVTAIPQTVLNGVGREKRLTRAAMRGIVPDPVLERARKIVPTPLFDRGLRDRARDKVMELLRDMEAERRGWVSGAALRREYRAILQGGGDVALFWHALSCEFWLRKHWPDRPPHG
jgi:asparagine synthase (glutamine-hydrolysing)